MPDQEPPAPPSPKPAVAISRPARTGDTVAVACKLPSGLILRVFEWQAIVELNRDGTSREGKRAVPREGMQFVIRGPWVATAGQAYNSSNSAVRDLLPGGYAITEGCPREVWDGWLEQNKQSDLVKNQIVFAHRDRNSLINEVRKLAAVRSGLEPIDRANPAEKMGGIDRRLKFGVLDQEGVDR